MTTDLHSKIFPEINTDDYICSEDLIPDDPIVLEKTKIEKWTSDLLMLAETARNIALKYRNKYFYIREDYNAVVDLYLNHSREKVIMRPDAIIENRQLKILELNMDSGIGGFWEVERIQSVCKKVHKNEESYWLSPKTAWINFFESYIPKFGDKLHIAIVGSQYLSTANLYKVKECTAWLQNSPSLEAFYVQPQELCGDGQYISYEGTNIHVVYRYRSLLHSVEQVEEMTVLMEKVYNSQTVLLSDPIDLLVEQKGILAILSSLLDNEADRKLLTEKELELIDCYIPWTRLLSDTVYAYKGQIFSRSSLLSKRKNDMVIKRMHSHHGDHVLIGSECSQQDWGNVCAKVEADPKQWVVQEKLTPDVSFLSYRLPDGTLSQKPKKFIFSPYFFGEFFGGALVRIQQKENNQVLSLPTMSPMGFASVKVA